MWQRHLRRGGGGDEAPATQEAPEAVAVASVQQQQQQAVAPSTPKKLLGQFLGGEGNNLTAKIQKLEEELMTARCGKLNELLLLVLLSLSLLLLLLLLFWPRSRSWRRRRRSSWRSGVEGKRVGLAHSAAAAIATIALVVAAQSYQRLSFLAG